MTDRPKTGPVKNFNLKDKAAEHAKNPKKAFIKRPKEHGKPPSMKDTKGSPTLNKKKKMK